MGLYYCRILFLNPQQLQKFFGLFEVGGNRHLTSSPP